jgi:ankyrin repeat protein
MLRKSLTTLPQTLDQTYDRILTAISEQDRDCAMRILQWLTFSARPMSVEEIAEVVAIDVARDPAFDRDEVLEDPLEALNICSSLVTISTVQSDPDKLIISLAHYSVREYLVSDRIKQGPARQYTMKEGQCHGVIMDGCLKYLVQLRQPLSEDVIQISALARYAAEYWSSHLGQTGEDIERWSQSATGLMSTEHSAYLIWIQLYNPDNPWMRPDPKKDLKSVAAPLYYAALLGMNTITKLLLKEGAEVNTPGGRYGNALHAAAVKGHKQVVETLLKVGADIDAQSGNYGNPLQAASYEGHKPIVQMLLLNKADVNAQGGKYGNALQSASAAGHWKIVQLLLDNSADVNMRGGLYNSALNAAAAESHTDIVRLLLENGAEISQHDVQRKGVMHYATNSAYCTLSLVKLLLSQDAPTNTTDIDNMTPLYYSVKFNHESIVGLLLDNSMSIDAGVHRKSWSRKTDTTYQVSITASEPDISCTATGLTLLHFAALTGNSAMTEFLLKRGADPNALSRYNESPTHLTLRKALHGPKYDDDWTDPHCKVEGSLDFLDFEEDAVDTVYADIAKHREGVLSALLADPRTSLSIRDYQDEQPLHCVEYGKIGSLWTVKALVSRGANPLEGNLKQQNALHLASRAGDHDVVAFLLSLGAEPALSDEEGLNALHHAARSGHFQTISLLLETAIATRPSLVASRDTLGRNLLHHLSSATFKARKETIKLLLDTGVDGSALDESGSLPLATYFKKHWLVVNVDICQLLISVEGNSLSIDKNGRNLGHLCASTLGCSVQVLEILRIHGVDLTQKDLRSRTLLHYAAISGSVTEGLLHYLLHVVDVEVNAEDASGKTPLQLAAEMGLEDHDPQMYDFGR